MTLSRAVRWERLPHFTAASVIPAPLSAPDLDPSGFEGSGWRRLGLHLPFISCLKKKKKKWKIVSFCGDRNLLLLHYFFRRMGLNSKCIFEYWSLRICQPVAPLRKRLNLFAKKKNRPRTPPWLVWYWTSLTQQYLSEPVVMNTWLPHTHTHSLQSSSATLSYEGERLQPCKHYFGCTKKKKKALSTKWP